MIGSQIYFTILIHGGFIMYEKYLQQLEEAGKSAILHRLQSPAIKTMYRYF